LDHGLALRTQASSLHVKVEMSVVHENLHLPRGLRVLLDGRAWGLTLESSQRRRRAAATNRWPRCCTYTCATTPMMRPARATMSAMKTLAT
jgi:hypothetical protein